MTRRQRRMVMVALLVAGVGIAVGLGLKAFQQNLLYFVSPSEIAKGEAPQGRPFRIGGMVKEGSVQRQPDGLKVRFVLTDYANDVTVQYKGILPDLFREGQGVVCNGQIGPDGVFVASEVLAKHDENYMPPEVADALKQAEADKSTAKTTKP
jgi:cytochrome c-type biogenesis protein CcmE